MVKALIDAGADLDARAGPGFTPLHAAAALSRLPRVVTVLVEAGADIEARGWLDMTPLITAAKMSETPGVLAALLDAGADPKAQTSQGRSVWDAARKNDALRDTRVYERLRALVSE